MHIYGEINMDLDKNVVKLYLIYNYIMVNIYVLYVKLTINLQQNMTMEKLML